MIDSFTKLGIAGASLLILFFLGKEFFKYLNKRSDAETKDSSKVSTNMITSVNRLCDKIDKLIEAYHNNTSTAAQNQASIKSSTDIQLTLLQDIKGKVDHIDERTKLLIPEKEGVKNV